jgi:hypothetical protein
MNSLQPARRGNTPFKKLNRLILINTKAIWLFLEARNIRRLQKHGFAVTVPGYFAALKLLLRTFISSITVEKLKPFNTAVCLQFSNSEKEAINPSQLQDLNEFGMSTQLANQKIKHRHKSQIEKASSPISIVFSIIGFALISIRLAFEPHRLAPKSAFWIWFRWYNQVVNAVQLSELNDAPIIWENLDEPPTNVLGSLLKNRLIGLHGPASIETHNSDQEVQNVIFRYSWQWQEAQSLMAYKVKGCAILTEPKIDAAPHLTTHPFENKVLFISSGYWLREKLGMFFQHEVKPAEIEAQLKKKLCEDHLNQTLVIPHPRELQYHEMSKSHYERLGLQLSTLNLASIIPLLSDLDSISIVGGTSTAFSCFPDQYPQLISRTQIIVDDSTLKRVVAKTSLGQMYRAATDFFSS